MKQYLIRFLVVLMATASYFNVFAKEYGGDKTACDIRYFVTSGTVNTFNHNQQKVRILNAGDYIYVDSDELYYADTQVNGVDAEALVKISSSDEYVLSYLLTIEDNPYYVPVDDSEFLETASSMFKFGFYNIPKWLGVTMFITWILLSFILCLRLSNYRFDLRWCPGRDKRPVVLDVKDPIYGYGQKKNFFFSEAPYKLFLSIAGYFLAAFVATILLFLLIGGLAWAVTWIGRILILIIFWVLFIGIALLGLAAVLNTIFVFIGNRILSIVVVIIAWGITEWMGDLRYVVSDWGADMVEWGTSVFTTFNIFNVAMYIVKTYWFTALCISATPLVLFLIVAFFFMIYAGVLVLIEYVSMKRYNVSHPCPYCGEFSEPAVYLSEGIPLKVPLRPSIWGMYHITHPYTGEQMPTLFSNGKDKLERRCKHCDTVISANIGIEKHIAVAGVPNSGKSTLLYRIISELCRMKKGDEYICSFTDTIGGNEAAIKNFLDSIKDGQKIEDGYFPEKTSEGRHKSIQLLAENSESTLPYRLFVNDIAGEMFTISNNEYEDAPFFKNTNVLIFALDPFTMRAKDLEFSDEFAAWYKQNVGDQKSLDGKVDLFDAFTTLMNTIRKYRADKDFSKIHLMITYVKTDTGYLDELSDKNDSALLREFAISEMGLENLIDKLESEGFQISYHAVSASDEAQVSGVTGYLSNILDNLDVSFDKLTEKDIKQRRASRAKSAFKKKEIKKQKTIDSSRGAFMVVLSFVLAAIAIIGASKYVSSVQEDNYNATMQMVDRASSEPNNYDEVMSIIKTAVAEEYMSEDHVEKLTELYKTADREKKKKISNLRSLLYANFEVKKGRPMSNIELSMKYNIKEAISKVKKLFEEFEKLDPEDAFYIKYSNLFNQLLTKYNIEL